VGSCGAGAAAWSFGAAGDGLATPQPAPPVAARRTAAARMAP